MNGWECLDWDYVCSQAPGIISAHEKASRGEEYGVNFYEFINTEEGLGKYAQEWWDSLSVDRKWMLLINEADTLRNKLDNVNNSLESIKNGK
jgi:hypothetical protein